jgi:phosphoribosyl 1,2-cyclic phosphodiesterase
MRVKFWGTRGSLPVALDAQGVRRKLASALRAAQGKKLESQQDIDSFLDSLDFATAGTYGGASSCVEIQGGSEYVLCDLGSGVQAFSREVQLRHGPFRGNSQPQTFHVFMSHLHWDHMMGFPFFTQAYQAGHKFFIYGCHQGLKRAFMAQHSAPGFPVDFANLAAELTFVRLEPGGSYDIAGFKVRPSAQHHGGDSYGYRFEKDGKSVVYATDSEYKLDNPRETGAAVAFFKGADLLVFDAMYSLADSMTLKEDYGHSSNMVGVELAQMAEVKRLALFHHEPANDDHALDKILADSRRLEEITRDAHAVDVLMAYDGLTVVL